MNTKINLKELADYVSDRCQLDIRQTSRKTEFVQARTLYYLIAIDSGVTLNEASSEVGQTHSQALHCYKYIGQYLEKERPDLKRIYRDWFGWSDDRRKIIELEQQLDRLKVWEEKFKQATETNSAIECKAVLDAFVAQMKYL